MKRQIQVLSVILAVLLSFTNVFADDAKRQELMDAVEYGVQLINSKGKAAFSELDTFRFDNGVGYLYVTNADFVVIMHPVAPELLNKDCTAIKGARGKYFGAEMKHKAINYGSGWTSYWWPNPKNNNVPELKCSYFKTAMMDGEKVTVFAAAFGISEQGCQ